MRANSNPYCMQRLLGRPSKMVEQDWNYIFNESKKKEVTLLLLWTEFKRKEPNAYQYSQFCERYRQWRKAKQVSLRQIHRAGEKLFIDYAGPTIPIIDGTSVKQADRYEPTLDRTYYEMATHLGRQSMFDAR